MSPDLFRQLAALGLSTEQIAGVLEIMESEAEVRKEKGRARWRKWKDNQPTNVSQRLQTSTNVNSQLTRVEGSSSKKDISGKEEKKEGAAKPRVDLDGFKAELSPILDPDRIDALVAVRRKKGAVLSAHAGRILSQALLACPDAAAAADEMVLRNWTGIKPDWLQKRTTGPPRAGKPNAFDAYEQIARERGWNEPEILPGTDSDAQRFSPEQRGHPGAVVDLRTGTDWHRR